MAKNPPKDVKFQYGECKTDWKSGDELRETRHIDFMNEEPYASRVKETLEKMGLPQPNKNEVFRGTHHDLLFLDSHGVMLRIGPTDVPDLMNPAVIQPLGWVEDKTNPIQLGEQSLPFTVAVYPGIELYRDFLADKNNDNTTTDLHKFLNDTGQAGGDLHPENLGIIRVKGDDGKEVGVKLLLDPDNAFNASDSGTGENKINRFTLAQQEIGNNADAMEATIGSTLGTVENAALYQRAFEVHQPLRRMFSDFMENKGPDGKPNQNGMKNFWNACASTVNNPKTHFHNMAHYRADGPRRITFSAAQPIETVLYRSWTGNSRDVVASVKKQLANAKKPPIQRAISKFIAGITEMDSPAARHNRHQPRLVRKLMRNPLVKAIMHNPLADMIVKIDQQVNFLLVDLPRKMDKRVVNALKNMKEKNAPTKQQQGPQKKQSSGQKGMSKPASSVGMFARYLGQNNPGEIKKAENGFGVKSKTMAGMHGEKGGILKMLGKAQKSGFKTTLDRTQKQKISYAASGPKVSMGSAPRMSAPSPGGMKK